MKYVSWATFYEGESDALYLDVLLPRIIRDVIAREGSELVEVPEIPVVRLGQNGREIGSVAKEMCQFRDALDIVFVHADTGGRGLERNIQYRSTAYCEEFERLCEWPCDQCITVTPRHETEAWLLADGLAVTDALGYNGPPEEIGLPQGAIAAERLQDPKKALQASIEMATGRRRSKSIENIFPAIAQRQRVSELRGSASFLAFEQRLRNCLVKLRCLPVKN